MSLSAVDSPAGLAAALAGVGYLADEGLAVAGFLALRLRRPVFLEGDAGVGKTAFAGALAEAAGLELIRLQCYEGLDASQALYDWDFPRQVLHLRAVEARARAGGPAIDPAGVEADLYDRRFLVARPLLQAVEPAPCVLLVDEVDRADDEFEAYLLELLADAAVTVPELGRIVAAEPPLVVVTSNRTREVHDALKRRCLYHWVAHPDPERETAILTTRLPELTARLAGQVAAAMARLRALDLVKPPGVAEAIDWAAALGALGADALTVDAIDLTLGTVLKVREDLDRVRALPPAALLESLNVPHMDVIDFVQIVRRGGVQASPDRVHELVRALGALPQVDPTGLYWAGRLTLCGTPEDVARYDVAVTTVPGRPREQAPSFHIARLPDRALFRPGGRGGEAEQEVDPLAVAASEVEVLRHRDLAALSDVERVEAARLLALMARVDPRRPGRRHRPSHGGSVDPRRTLRRMLKTDGEPARLARRVRRPRPRRLVLLIDVSGSMSPYADALLRLAHAAVRHRPRWTEVYTVGTRLTRVTGALLRRDPAEALRETIPDWRGGTRLADTLTAFLRRDGHRGTARGAVVVLCSDGWERGDPAALGAAVAHLGRLAYRLIWVSPHAGRPGFAPTAGGLAAALPYLDALVSGHSVAALEELAREVARA